MSRLGLRGRVTLASVGVLLVAMIVLSVGANVLLSRTLDQDASVVLQARADALVSTVEVAGGEVVVRDFPSDKPPGYQTWVFAEGRTLAGPPGTDPVTGAAVRLATVTEPTERLSEQGDVRLLATPIFADDGVTPLATVVVGLSTIPYERAEQRATIGTFVFALLVLLVGGAVAWHAVGAALAPVTRMASDAEDWSEHDLDRRFSLGPVRDELTALAATLDGLLGRIAASRRHEQRFSAEMAHEIRTPLAAVRGEAELLRRRADDPAAVTAGVEAMLDHADRVAEVVEVLMRAARNESDATAGTGDALEAAQRAAQAGRVAAEARGVAVTVSAPPTLPAVGAPTDLIERALQPLVDNAVRYAAHDVVLSALEEKGDVLLVVDDDGPGVPPALTSTLWEPGVRGDDSPGVGLGLALARRLALSCDGRVELVPGGSPRGGARLVLRLPALR